jgi:hypothetical protein
VLGKGCVGGECNRGPPVMSGKYWSVPNSLRLLALCFKHVSLVDPISGLMRS